MNNVLIFVEHSKGSTRKVTFELATHARQIADALGGKAHAVVLGTGAKELAEQLKAYPLDTVYVAEDGDVDAYLIDPSVDYVEAAAREIGNALVLVPNTLYGRDIAGRLAARRLLAYKAMPPRLSLRGERAICGRLR